MEASLKYHVSAFTASLSTKLVRIRQNPPLCLQSTPRGTQGFGKAGDFRYPPSCASSRGRVDLLMLLYHKSCKKKSGKPESLPLLNCQSKSSKLIPRQDWYITHPAFYQCLSAGSLPPSGCNVSVLQCPAAGAAQRTAVRLSYGLPSQAVRF
jgi:hypothetical protein